MTDLRTVKRRRETETLLERARRALPAPAERQRRQYEILLADYREFLAQKELGLALDALEVIGQLVPCRGGFWRGLERAAESLGLAGKVPVLRKRFCDALEEAHLPPCG
jgi:hypothetical protein